MNATTLSLNMDTECLPLKLQWVEPGELIMSNIFMGETGLNDLDDKEDQAGEFKVILSRGYWLGIYAVTRCQWMSVMGQLQPEKYNITLTNNMPVTDISWYDALDFCDKLNSMFPSRPEGYSFNLPTEAQWEYACKAGKEYKYQIGDSLTDLSNVAWHRENTEVFRDVGQKMPNHWGFYDMLGNVNEMVFDASVRYADGTIRIDPIGDTRDEYPFRVCRGGNVFINPIEAIDCSIRGQIETAEPTVLTGFRLCLRYGASS